MHTKLFLPLIVATLLFSSCASDWVEIVKGSGPVVSEDSNTSSFNEVTLSIPADVYIYQGTDEGITIEAQDNVLDVIRTEVRGSELNLRFENRVVVKRFDPLRFTSLRMI